MTAIFSRFTSDPEFFEAHIQLPRGAALPRLLRDRERLDRTVMTLKRVWRTVVPRDNANRE